MWSGYNEPYDSAPESHASTMMNNLFSKYGFFDGDHPRAEIIQEAFSDHLRSHGYENEILGSVHNRRVYKIRIHDKWYGTDLLPWGTDWSLIEATDEDPQDDTPKIPVPQELQQVILDFLPTGWEMMHPKYK